MTEDQQAGARPGLGEAVSLVAGLVRGVADDDLGRPTPCPGTSVAAMLDHLAGLTMAFTAAARHEPVPGGDQPPEPDAARPRFPQVDSRRPDRLGGRLGGP
jgi:uncharacterized protein (TIGR03083 family)